MTDGFLVIMFPEVKRELLDITALCWSRARPIKGGSQNAPAKAGSLC